MRFYILLCVFFTVLSSCSLLSSKKQEPLVDEKYTLSADREALAQLRAEIPTDVKKENDEKAFMDQLLSDPNQSPSQVRNRFSGYINKKRDQFNKDMSQVRQDFSETQKKERDQFSREQESARKDFGRQRVSVDQRKDFYDSQDMKRRNFFGQQRELRDKFEADSRDKRKNFDDYIKSKQDEFNQRFKQFLEQYEENLKMEQKKNSKSTSTAASTKMGNSKIGEEYESIRQKEPVMIESGLKGEEN